MKMTFIRKRYAAYLLVATFLCCCTSVFAQNKISGKVVDNTNFPLPGVTVVVTNTVSGTVTDINGEFELEVPENASSVTISFVGFKSQTIPLAGRSSFNVTLEEDVEQLEEVVITGYGQTQNKALVSSAISSLGTEVIEARPIANVEQAIQGNAPSVVVVQESGSPGASNTVRVRGTSTAGDASPLVLVNGVQVPDMNFINPNDIKEVSVFRDAASSAIYGARGGNGVLYLGMKDASDKENKLNIDVSAYYGVQSLLTEGEYLTGQEYAEYYNESYLYLVREDLTPAGRGTFTEEEMALLPNTSWIREVSDDAAISDFHVAFSGKLSDKTGYYASFGNFNQDGIIGNTSFRRRSGTVGIDQKIGKKLTVNVFATYAGNFREFIAENNVNSRLMSSVAGLPPIFPARDENGNPFDVGDRTSAIVVNGVMLNAQPEFSNPLVGLENTANHAYDDIFYGNAKVTYDLTDKLKINAAVGYLDRDVDIKSFGRTFSYPDSNFENLVNSLYQEIVVQEFKQFESYLNYSVKKPAYTLDVVGGMSLLENSYESDRQFGTDFSVNNIDDASFNNIVDESTIESVGKDAELNTTLSYYSRANLTFSDKYLFSATFRADASSKFGPNNKWGFFPSVSAGWLISDESFLKGSQNVNLLKLRASYGINGNDKIIAYGYVRRFDVLESTDGGVNLSRLDANSDIKWEEISQFNVGLDMDFFKNKFGVTLDYYIKETRDMLLEFAVPGYTGLPAPIRNAGDVRNKGFEAILLYRDRVSKSFRYELNLNFATIQNEVLSLNGAEPIAGANLRSFDGSPNISLTDEGSSIASFYGYVFDGVDAAGNATYKDLNNDNQITEEFDRTIIGNPFPDFTYGITTRFYYKKFDLSAFVQGTQGNDVVNSSVLYSVQYGNRTGKYVENAWTHVNDNSNVVRPSATEVANNEFSNYFIEDGSYWRVKNITLGYKLPANKILSDGRIYLSANNIFTQTEYSGLDPEIGENNDPTNVGIDQGFYPQAKSFLIGLNLSF